MALDYGLVPVLCVSSFHTVGDLTRLCVSHIAEDSSTHPRQRR